MTLILTKNDLARFRNLNEIPSLFKGKNGNSIGMIAEKIIIKTNINTFKVVKDRYGTENRIITTEDINKEVL